MKILYVTTIGVTMDFFPSLITELIHDGHIVDIATNECNGEARVNKVYKDLGCTIFPISCSRSPTSTGNVKAIKEIKQIVENNHYDIVHCHTPIAAACTRIACRKVRKTGTKVFYTAHGFHFYTGAPIKNWLIYYPVEWLCSWWTDTLITINTEDYERAKRHLHAKKTDYVPGVGVDTSKFGNTFDGQKIRDELGTQNFMLLSVGELNENKNHASVIKAVTNLPITYVIVGRGEKKEELETLVRECKANVKLAGFRTDVADFYAAADAYILPSYREGLNVSLMEAMASSLPCLAGNIRGNTDLVDENGGLLFDPHSIDEIRDAVEKIMLADRKAMGIHNEEKIQSFNMESIEAAMKSIYGEIGGGTEEVPRLTRILERYYKRAEIGVPGKAFLLMSVGELNENKNHSVVIRAVAEVPGVHYAIAGRGDLEDKLRTLVAELGIEDRVHILGFRSDVPELYAAADACVFPSIREGQGLAAIEGMASGLPLIVSDNRGTRGFVSSENGITCNYNDVDGFAEAIKKLLADSSLAYKTGQTNRRDSKYFDTKVINEQMKVIYS